MVTNDGTKRETDVSSLGKLALKVSGIMSPRIPRSVRKSCVPELGDRPVQPRREILMHHEHTGKVAAGAQDVKQRVYSKV